MSDISCPHCAGEWPATDCCLCHGTRRVAFPREPNRLWVWARSNPEAWRWGWAWDYQACACSVCQQLQAQRRRIGIPDRRCVARPFVPAPSRA